MLFEQHLAVLHEAVSECEGMKDAICLMKVWLHQRGISDVSETAICSLKPVAAGKENIWWGNFGKIIGA